MFAPSTISTYVSAVRFYHKSHGWPDPTTDFFVSKLLEGCKQLHPDNPDNAALCPVWALQRFLHVRPASAGPLFCHFDCTPLTRFQFNSVLQKTLKFAEVPSERIRAHFFHIGAASTAVNAGVPYDEVCRMGRWRSNAVDTYIRTVPSYEVSGTPGTIFKALS